MLNDQLEQTCELDVTRDGALGPRRTAELLGLTKQRVDQIVKTRTPYVRAALEGAE